MKEITTESLREILKMGIVFVLMTTAIVWQNSRISKVEERLEECEDGRIEDWKNRSAYATESIAKLHKY